MEHLDGQLRRQLAFLEGSCAAFDVGGLDEAIRIATAVRVLVHNNRRSVSLIRLLGLENIRFYDSAAGLALSKGRDGGKAEREIVIAFGPVALAFGKAKGGPRWSPILHNIQAKPRVQFADWWNKIFYRGGDMVDWDRKRLVLNMANKDGGAHVDPRLPTDYYNLTRRGSDGVQSPVNPNLANELPFFHMRVIGQEVLATFGSVDGDMTN